MIVRPARFLLTRLLFLAMGLPVRRYRKEVEDLWSLSEEARSRKLDQVLARNRPLNSEGVAVTGLEALSSSPALSKKQLRTQSRENEKGRAPRFGRHTAGTTGEPTQVSLSRAELARMLGVRDYCFRHYGVKLGQREARLWGRPEAGIKSRLKNFVMNRRVFHPVGPSARDVVVELLKWQPDYLYGYASLLLEAARVLESTDLKFKPPKCVVCTAESILPAQKAYISQAFKAPVAEEYGSTEFDVIAFECPDGHRHLVNPWLIVEDLDDVCVVSDVSRESQSLIKYQLGDSLSMSGVSCQLLGGDIIVDQLQGRTLDRFFYVDQHEKIHATVFSLIFDKYFLEHNEVFCFTVVQVEFSEVKVFVDLEVTEIRDDIRDFIKCELFDRFNIIVNVEVDFLSNEDRSEKRNYFVQSIPDLL